MARSAHVDVTPSTGRVIQSRPLLPRPRADRPRTSFPAPDCCGPGAGRSVSPSFSRRPHRPDSSSIASSGTGSSAPLSVRVSRRAHCGCSSSRSSSGAVAWCLAILATAHLARPFHSTRDERARHNAHGNPLLPWRSSPQRMGSTHARAPALLVSTVFQEEPQVPASARPGPFLQVGGDDPGRPFPNVLLIGSTPDPTASASDPTR